MQYWRSAVVTFFILIVVILLASCGGGHSSNTIGPITSIVLSPSALSLNDGDTFQMTVSATDAKGHTVLNQTFTFNSSNPNVAEIATGGLLCAGGQWFDNQKPPQRSLTNPIICSPTSPPVSNTTNITVTAQGVTSNSVTVNVHPKVARVVVNPANPACVSQTGAVSYTATAFDVNGADVTNSVGTFNWSIADSSIGTLSNTSTAAGTPNSVTAVIPGATTVTATVNSTNPVNSVAAIFQECAVASIAITGPDATNNPNLAFSPSPGAIGATGQLTAVVMDTNTPSKPVTGVTLSWNSSLPSVASVSSSGLVTGVAFGTSNITASCAANSACNKNQASVVTSNTVVANVGPGATATTVYATSSQGGNTSLVPIDTSTNTAGTAISLPATPNSLVFDPTGANAYLGSDSGLIVVNAATNPPTISKTVSNAPGHVLAVSPNGQFVLIGGQLANNNFVSTVVFNNSANTVAALPITAAVAGDCSPDGSEAVVADTTGIRAAQGTAVRTVSSTTVAKSVSFLATGALAYLAAANTPSVVVCNSTFRTGGASGTPTLVKTLPDGSKVLGSVLPNLVVVAVTTSGTTCPPTITETPVSLTFAAGGSTAGQIIITPDGKHAYITSDVAGKLLSYDAVGNATGSVTLSSGTATTTNTTGGSTLDSASVYVGVKDGTTGSVHRIDVNAGTDATQIPVTFIPDLVAVRPH